MPIYKQRLFSRLYRAPEGEGEGGGGEDQAALIQKAVDAAVAGLKAKNAELLGKNKEFSQKLSEFDGIDPGAVRTILSKFASDEEAGLIAKGDIDTVLKKRTERLQADYEKKLKGESERAAKLESKASKLAARTLSGAIRDAAIKADALPEAMEDIVLRAGPTWRLNDEGDPVAMNGEDVVLGKDGKTPLTPQEWAESLRETAPHLWPRAQGTNAPGSGSGPRGGNKGKIDGTDAERAAYYASKFPALS